MSGTIHATAIVAPDAILGDDVEIGPYCVIGAGRRDRRAHAPRARTPSVSGPTSIGVDNLIHQFASVGDAPQDKKYKGEPTRLEIGDRNVIREFVTLNRGTTKDHGVTTIGNDNLFMAYSHVAHDCIVGNQCVLANSATLGGHVELGDWVDHGRLRRRPPVLQGRRACVPRQQRRRHARRAAVRDGRRAARPSRTASTPKASSAAASRRSRSATSATPTACSTARA